MAATLPDPELIGQNVLFEPADDPDMGAPSRPDAVIARQVVPSGEAQEICYFPDGRAPDEPPIRLFFDTDAPDLEHQLAAVTESVYVLGGKEDVLRLGSALRSTRMSVHGMAFPLEVQGEKNYLDAVRTPKRHALVSLYPQVQRDLFIRASGAVEEFQPAAAQWARELVLAQRRTVVDEAYRYLTTGPADRPADPAGRLREVRRLLGSVPFGVSIGGPDAAALVGALRAVKAPRDALDALDRAVRDRRIGRALDQAWAGIAVSPLLLAALPLERDTPAEREADIDARLIPATEIERIGAGHPIVHRLWTTDAVDRVHSVAAANPRFTDQQIADRLFADHAYRSAVAGALARTLEACDALLTELQQHEHVWRYPRALRGAQDARAIPNASLTAAAVREHLAKKADEESWIAQVNDVIGYCQLIAMAGGVTAPAAGVLEVASIALDVLEAGESVWHAWLQTAASRTHLDPSMSLAAEPSYVGCLLAVVATSASAAFGLRGLLK